MVAYESRKHAFSFALIHWLFCLLFFFFAPMVQYIHNNFPWVRYRGDNLLFDANIFLLIWSIGVWTGQNFKLQSKSKRTIKQINSIKVGLCSPIKYCFNENVYLIITIAIMLWRVKNIGIINLLSRGTNTYEWSNSSATALLFDHIMQATEYMSAVVLIAGKKSPVKALLASICLFIAYPPTGQARYAAAAICLGFILTFSNRIKKGRCFLFLFLGGYLIVLPALNAFRHTDFLSVNFIDILSTMLKEYRTIWLEGDYDAYTMFTMSIDYVRNHGSTHFMQFIGALLFWIPREIWPTKPVGSGYHMAETLGWSFKNLSCPLPGEAMINFGVPGIVLFSLLIGKMTRTIDGLYWSNQHNSMRCIDILYPVLTIFFFFISRGDMMSSMAYTMAYVAVGLVLTGFFMNHSE